jgi:hypothetical protein
MAEVSNARPPLSVAESRIAYPVRLGQCAELSTTSLTVNWTTSPPTSSSPSDVIATLRFHPGADTAVWKQRSIAPAKTILNVLNLMRDSLLGLPKTNLRSFDPMIRRQPVNTNQPHLIVGWQRRAATEAMRPSRQRTQTQRWLQPTVRCTDSGAVELPIIARVELRMDFLDVLTFWRLTSKRRPKNTRTTAPAPAPGPSYVILASETSRRSARGVFRSGRSSKCGIRLP